MKEYSKKFFIFIMCGWLAFSSSYIVYDKSYCYAMEWAGVVAGLDSAFKFMLGLVGVSVGVGVADQVDWGTVRNDCMNFQQNQGNSSVAVSKWWSDICDGALDTASSCWDSFVDYASSLVSDVGSDIAHPISGTTLGNAITTLLNNSGFNFSSNVSINLQNEYIMPYSAFCFMINGGHGLIRFYLDEGVYSFTNHRVTCTHSDGTVQTSDFNCYWIDFYSSTTSITDNMINSGIISYDGDGWSSQVVTFLNFTVIEGLTHATNNTFDFGDTSVGTNSIFKGITKNISNLKVINQGDTTIEGDTVINIPWENVGDNTSAIDDVIQGLIDKVNEGVLSLEELCEKLQVVSNTYVYDTTTNNIFPSDDESIEDKINENKSNMGFTLFGLEKFFPFCIPWDIYAFLGILEATPQAPQIPIPMPNVRTKQIDTYILDMSPLEPLAVVIRYGFDFMFIIGLALASRRLIGAGGGE